MAARLCTLNQGLPTPSCATFNEPGCAGHANLIEPPCALWRQSTAPRSSASVAVVRPPTRTDSNFAENLSSASAPHRLAVVVSHAPPRWRPSEPTTMRGRSSRQAGSSSTARIARAALASALSISHHQKSPSSWLNFSVVPA